MEHHLAQLNIGIIAAPLESAQLRDFMDALEPVNARADAADGFVWRLQTEAGDATSIRPFERDDMLVNMSVWRSLPDLRAFVYANHDHAAIMRRRREFFEPMTEAIFVLWWIPAGHIPTVDEARERLELLRAQGPTARAFTFRAHFPPPGADDSAGATRDDRWLCPA